MSVDVERIESSPSAPRGDSPGWDRIPHRQKLGYGLGAFVDMWGHGNYGLFAYVVFGQFLGVNLTLIGIAVVFNQLMDALWNPVFGWMSDNTRSPFGRRRIYLLIGAIAAGLGLPLLVAVGPGWGSTHLWGRTIPNYFWFMLGSSALYLPLVSCFCVPYSSLGYELTPDYQERTRLFAWKYVLQQVPLAGLFFGGKFVSMAAWVGATPSNLTERLKALATHLCAWGTAPARAHPNLLLGSQVFAVGSGLLMIVAGLACFRLVSEPFYRTVVARGKSRVSLREAVWETLRCRPFRSQVAMSVAFGAGLSMVGTLGYSATIYFVCRGNISTANHWNFLMGLAGMGAGVLGAPLFAAASRVWGKRHAMAAVFATGLLVFVAAWWLYTPSFPALQIAASGLIAFIGAGFWMLHDSIGADIVDYDELETGKRREGAFAASLNFFMKSSMAVGAGLSFVILDWVGLDCKLEGAQSARTLLEIRLFLSGVPLIGLAFALWAVLRLNLSEKRMAEIRQMLEARRGVVGTGER
ncbi:MAG TPA: MFS transporter [Opitutaceae bacterium]|jgi:GPH family glycoside/pentoside/hexuronide:cation symporter